MGVFEKIDLPQTNLDKIKSHLSTPSFRVRGHLSLPLFSFASVLKKKPVILANEWSQKILNFIKNEENSLFLDESKKNRAENLFWKEIVYVQALNGFINFYMSSRYLRKSIEESVLQVKNISQIGHNPLGQGRKIVVDFSSPNVAKPMHIGHLRATVIGQAVCNLVRTQGYEVCGLNHLGDWGVQFGKLIWAYEKWGAEYDFKTEAFESLYKLYVRFHEEAEKDSSLNSKGSEMFKKLEKKEPEQMVLWKKFIDISMDEYTKIWNLLGVKHDLVRGESFYNNRLEEVKNLLKKKKLLKESQGALVVEMSENIPPCLIEKTDGASLYATRDIASAIYRFKDLEAYQNLYVVGVEQKLHFKQIFEVFRKMGFSWAQNCHHVSFGRYRFKEKENKKMSSRKGQIVRLDEVLRQAVERVEKIIESKNPQLKNKKEVARQVAVGAIIFNDLKNERIKDVDFDWEKILNFNGDSGPYVQYTAVRCVSLIKKYKELYKEKEIPAHFDESFSGEADFLVLTLLKYADVLKKSFQHYKPHLIASYLLDLCYHFNKFYRNYKILSQEESHLVSNRMALVEATYRVLLSGLGVLNIECPESM